jgi:hypothetical protein
MAETVPVDSWTGWVPVIAASVGLIGVLVTLTQKWRNDRRDAWWKRTQWALDKATAQEADESTRVIGLTALRYLQVSSLATDADREMLDEVADEILRTWRSRS